VDGASAGNEIRFRLRASIGPRCSEQNEGGCEKSDSSPCPRIGRVLLSSVYQQEATA